MGNSSGGELPCNSSALGVWKGSVTQGGISEQGGMTFPCEHYITSPLTGKQQKLQPDPLGSAWAELVL